MVEATLAAFLLVHDGLPPLEITSNDRNNRPHRSILSVQPPRTITPFRNNTALTKSHYKTEKLCNVFSQSSSRRVASSSSLDTSHCAQVQVALLPSTGSLYYIYLFLRQQKRLLGLSGGY